MFKFQLSSLFAKIVVKVKGNAAEYNQMLF